MRSLNIQRKPVVVVLCIAVAALHLFTGPTYSGPARLFVMGYLIDLSLPFSLVLLLGVDPGVDRLLLSPVIRAFLVFLLGATVELAQFLGVPLFGRTFDPLDLAMYAVGVVAAVAFEHWVFSPHALRTGA
jgi:hypothetical protein